MSATAAILAAVLSASTGCPPGVDACPDGAGYHFTAEGKARVDARLTSLTRDLAACTAERDFLHRVLQEQPVAAPATPTSTVIALSVGLAVGVAAGAFLTYRAMR